MFKQRVFLMGEQDPKYLKNEKKQSAETRQKPEGPDNAERTQIPAEPRLLQPHTHRFRPIACFLSIVALLLLAGYLVSKRRPVPPSGKVNIEKRTGKPGARNMEKKGENRNNKASGNAPEIAVTPPPADINDANLEKVCDEAPKSDDSNLDDREKPLDVVPHSTHLKMPGLYSHRTRNLPPNAVLKALRWLAKEQNRNGSWANDPAHTGMALLCFLSYGETPLSEEFGLTVQKAMEWLTNGMPTNGQPWGSAYRHGIATYALAEAYGMTRIPFLRTAMEAGVDVILAGQQQNGGFDYHYKKGARWDMSVSSWQIQALKAAFVAGSTNPNLKKGIEKAIHFCRKVAYKDGTFGYCSPGGSHTLTGAGALCLQFADL